MTHFLLLQTCFELFHSSLSVSYHIAYDVLSSVYAVIVHLTRTHTKAENKYYPKGK